MTYLLNTWYMAAWSDELEASGFVVRTIAGIPLLLVREEEGTCAALRDECPHRFAPLSFGHVCATSVTCGYHGLRFDLQGKCVANPHGPVVSALTVETFECSIKFGGVWVWLGDAALSDLATIPDLTFVNETPKTAFTKGYEPIAANYLLCTDNILDLSHADYLHPDSLGGGATTRAKSKVETRGEIVRVEWFAEGDVAPPALAPALPDPGAPVDIRISVEWHAPGVMILQFGATPAGRPENEGVNTSNVHVMTPETQGRTHYFFWNSRNFMMEDGAFNEFVRGMLLHAFANEDKRMLEGQQLRIGTTPFDERRPVLLRTDAGSTQVRRMADKLLLAEAAA